MNSEVLAVVVPVQLAAKASCSFRNSLWRVIACVRLSVIPQSVCRGVWGVPHQDGEEGGGGVWGDLHQWVY